MIAEAITGLESMAILHSGRFVLEVPVSRPDRQFFYIFCFSVLLHGLILALPVSSGNRSSSALKTLPIQVRIRANVLPAANGAESAQTERRFAHPSSREPDPAHATILHSTQQQPLKNNLATLPESDTPPKTSFNMEVLREQARTMAKKPSDQLVRSTNANRYAQEKSLPDLAGRPILEALSKHLGKPLLVMSEQIMNDGSRFIRFSGNTCLHIPRHLPFGRETRL